MITKKRYRSTGMPRSTKRSELAEWLDRHHPACITVAEFGELRRALAPISEDYLRRLLRDSGMPLAPLVEGVRQASFDELETSLLRLLEEYERGDRAAARRLVMTAKDHARLAARRPEHRGQKEEMVLWLLTWLENPPLFPGWVRIRRGLLRR